MSRDAGSAGDDVAEEWYGRCYTGRVAAFNIVGGVWQLTYRHHYWSPSGHTWEELKEHLRTMGPTSKDVKVDATDLGDNVKLMSLSIAGWLDYIHL